MAVRTCVCLLALAALLLTALPAWAVTVAVESRGETQVVNGIATITLGGVTGKGNYVVIHADGKYVAAVGPPFTYAWDTRTFDDGPVTVKVSEVTEDGGPVSTASTTVRVANAVTVETPIELKWGLLKGATIQTTISGSGSLYDTISNEQRFVPGRLYRALSCALKGEATDTVVDVAADKLLVDRELTSLMADYPDRIVEMAGSGQKTSIAVQANGQIVDGTDKGVVQARANMLWLPLPTKPVDVGAQWSGDMIFIASAQTGSVDKQSGNHQLVGFAMWNGHKCALIESRARYTSDLVVKMTSEDATFPRARTLVRRLSFFALDTGSIVRVEEHVERMLTIKAEDWGVSSDSFREREAADQLGQPKPEGSAGEAGAGEGTGPRRGESGPGAGGLAGMTGYGTTTPAGTTREVHVPDDLDLIYAIATNVDVK